VTAPMQTQLAPQPSLPTWRRIAIAATSIAANLVYAVVLLSAGYGVLAWGMTR